jgi:ABC-type nitrate/sulfonate/bicarbonate transport system permease component
MNVIRRLVNREPGSLSRRKRRIAKATELSRRSRIALGISGIVVLLGAWEAAYRLGAVSKITGSSPSQIGVGARVLVDNHLLFSAIWSSTKLFLIGFSLCVGVGLIVGLVLGWYKRLHAILDPWVTMLYAAPRLAVIPLGVVWVGIGVQAQVVIVFLVGVFPMIINTMAGVMAMDRTHLRVARSFLATDKDVLLTVALPGALPFIIAGIRQTLVLSLTGVVVAEYFLGETGVGGLIFKSGQVLETGQAFVGVAIFCFAAVVLTVALGVAERRFDKWRV